MQEKKSNGYGPFILSALLFTCVLFVARLWLIPLRYFDSDELEHFHAAFLVHQGQVPYRDFFEMHLPGIYYFLSLLFHFFPSPLDPDSAVQVLYAGRRISWILTFIILAITGWGSFRLFGRRVAVLAVLVLSATGIFEQKSIELRPDLFCVPLELLGVFLWGEALQKKELRLFFISVFALSVAGIFSQKIFLLVPGIILSLWLSRKVFSPRYLLHACVIAVFPWLCLGFYFGVQNGLSELIQYNFFRAFTFSRFSAAGYLKQWLLENPVLCLTGWAGLFVLSACSFKSSSSRVLCIMSWAWVLGLALHPAPYRQYYLMGLPFFAVTSAYWIMGRIEKAYIKRVQKEWALVLVSLLIFMSGARLYYQEGTEKVHSSYTDRIRAVMKRTLPTDSVLDGLTGGGTFRPHAWKYFFLQKEIWLGIPSDEREQFKSAFRNGEIRPQIIIWDHNLKELLGDLEPDLQASYRQVDPGLEIWERR